MSEPLKPLVDHGVDPKRITAAAIIHPATGETLAWEVRASADIMEGVMVQMHSVQQTLHSAANQCIEQLNAAKGVDIKLLGNA